MYLYIHCFNWISRLAYLKTSEWFLLQSKVQFRRWVFVKSNPIKLLKSITNLSQVWRLNQIAKSVSNLTQVYDAIMNYVTEVWHWFRRQIFVESNSHQIQLPMPSTSFSGLCPDFSAFSMDWACVLYCAPCSLQFSIMAIQSELSFVAD